MRQDKDRCGKWLFKHYGNGILTLGGFQGYSSWRAAQPETVAPRRLPDGLLELRYPGKPDPEWVLVEVETYPGRDVDRQVFEDVQIVRLDKGVVPEVICLVLRPRGQVDVTGQVEQVSPRQTAGLSAWWKVVRLWDLRAEDLLAIGEVGLIPWVPLTHSDNPPEAVLAQCRQRIDRVSDPSERAGLLAVTQILAALAYPDQRLMELFGGIKTMIESPLLDEVYELVRAKAEAEGQAKGRAEGQAKGWAEGQAKGWAEGQAKGRAEGRAEGEMIGIIHICERLLNRPETPTDQLAGLSLEELNHLGQELQGLILKTNKAD